VITLILRCLNNWPLFVFLFWLAVATWAR